MNKYLNELHESNFNSDATWLATADTADLWQDMGIVFTGKNMGDLNGVRFGDINGDVSSVTFFSLFYLLCRICIVEPSVICPSANFAN